MKKTTLALAAVLLTVTSASAQLSFFKKLMKTPDSVSYSCTGSFKDDNFVAFNIDSLTMNKNLIMLTYSYQDKSISHQVVTLSYRTDKYMQKNESLVGGQNKTGYYTEGTLFVDPSGQSGISIPYLTRKDSKTFESNISITAKNSYSGGVVTCVQK
jgi:hypothetical protein